MGGKEKSTTGDTMTRGYDIALTITLASFLPCLVFAQAHSRKLEISHLTGDFYVFTTYRTLQGTPFPSNGMYIVTDNGVVMIDTPWDTTQFQPLLDSIRTRHDKDVVLCIATHSHEDRTGGFGYYRQQGVRTYATTRTDDICRERGEQRAEFLIVNDTVFTVGQHSVRTFYGGEGHTPDNIVIWFEEEDILYGGCLVKSVEATGLGNLADANKAAWPATIRNIQRAFGRPRYVIPGHQGWGGGEALEHTLELLRSDL
jgi:glyoxylase-like metal-dependent hydrolase (beta-lactamase superfamily II)